MKNFFNSISEFIIWTMFYLVIGVLCFLVCVLFLILFLFVKNKGGCEIQEDTLYRGWAYQPNLFDRNTTHVKIKK